MASSKSSAQWKDEIKTIINIPEELEPALGRECCIYKVPENLRMGNPEAYTPKLISIGPIHHGKFELEQMEEQKQRYFHFFLERLSKTKKESGFYYFRRYTDFVGANEEKIRSFYSEKYPKLSKEQFVKMILLDTVFIMELFKRHSENADREDDHLFSKLWLKRGIVQDLLLLENQVPIFVLEELYVVLLKSQQPEPSATRFVHDLACKYFAASFHPRPKEKPEAEAKANHFTDLIRCFCMPEGLTYGGPLPDRLIKSATKLKEAGVSFEPVSEKERPLLDIKFEKKTLLNLFLCFGCFPCSNCVKARFQFPKLTVDDSTECTFRNLIALEQCHYPKHRHYICSYFSMLDYLINSKDDVELLVEKGVIVHELGSDQEVATMINNLRKHVVITFTCYEQIIKDLNEHYDNGWKRFMGVIKWVYFRDLWRCSTTMVGVVFFVFAVINFYHLIGEMSKPKGGLDILLG